MSNRGEVKADLDVVQKTPNFECIGSPKNIAESTVLIVHWTGIKVLTTFASVFCEQRPKIRTTWKTTDISAAFCNSDIMFRESFLCGLDQISFLAILAKDMGLALLFTMHYWR